MADDPTVWTGFRERFAIPRMPRTAHGDEVAYFCGHSLGLMPLTAAETVGEVLEVWQHYGVDGHFEPEDVSWYRYDEPIERQLAPLVGAAPEDIACLGSLSTNLHLLLASFYRPLDGRSRIVVEADCFPSDRYVVETHLRWHGYDPEDHLVELEPVDGVHDPSAFADLMADSGESVAVVLLGGVNYLTGQLLDLEEFASIAHRAGALIGWDLAHGVGNVPLDLPAANADFAAWCSYKYLNGGPGAVAGIFVNSRHGHDPERRRLGGWWGNDPERRFSMDTERSFAPAPGARGWKISNPSIMGLAPLRASLGIFEEAGMERTRARALRMHTVLRTRLESLGYTITTPEAARAHGSQLSIDAGEDARALARRCQEAGVIVDYRPPTVIRIAPCGLYNSDDDIERLISVFGAA